MFLMSRNIITSRFGVVHFIGIGGIGMSGIAEILHNMGCNIQGSDISMNAQTKKLEDLGISITIGHRPDNVNNATVIVRSSAVKDDNPEIIQGRKLGIPIIQRAEMLAELMRFKFSIAIAGTHGKTTTTSLVACLFEEEDLSPTVINGGIINAKSTNAYLGEGEYLVAEADESDGSFTKLPATVAVVTNINQDHMDHYADYASLKLAFKNFVENIPFYGFGVICNDHHASREIVHEILDRRVITYGIENESDIMAANIRVKDNGISFDIKISEKLHYPTNNIKDCFVPILGTHNLLNSLAALAIGIELGFREQTIKNAFKTFKGVKRRFTLTGEVNGVRIYDDYAHHPEEIKSTISIAKTVVEYTKGKIIAIFQPHRYTRLKNLFADFIKAFDGVDHLIISDIYAAGETPIEGISRDVLIESIRQSNANISIMSLSSPDNIASIITEIADKGDLVLFMGAGSITNWANALPSQMISIEKKAVVTNV